LKAFFANEFKKIQFDPASSICSIIFPTNVSLAELDYYFLTHKHLCGAALESLAPAQKYNRSLRRGSVAADQGTPRMKIAVKPTNKSSRTVTSSVNEETALNANRLSHSCPTPELVEVIKAHLNKGKHAADRSEQHFISAGIQLWELKAREPANKPWPEYVRDTFHLYPPFADLLMNIANGSIDVATVWGTQKFNDAPRRPEQLSVDNAETPLKSTAPAANPAEDCGDANEPDDKNEDACGPAWHLSLRVYATTTVEELVPELSKNLPRFCKVFRVPATPAGLQALLPLLLAPGGPLQVKTDTDLMRGGRDGAASHNEKLRRARDQLKETGQAHTNVEAAEILAKRQREKRRPKTIRKILSQQESDAVPARAVRRMDSLVIVSRALATAVAKAKINYELTGSISNAAAASISRSPSCAAE